MLPSCLGAPVIVVLFDASVWPALTVRVTFTVQSAAREGPFPRLTAPGRGTTSSAHPDGAEKVHLWEVIVDTGEEPLPSSSTRSPRLTR